MDKLTLLDELLRKVHMGEIALGEVRETESCLLDIRRITSNFMENERANDKENMQSEEAGEQRRCSPLPLCYKHTVDRYAKSGGFSWEKLNELLDIPRLNREYGSSWQCLAGGVRNFFLAKGYMQAIVLMCTRGNFDTAEYIRKSE